MTTKTIRLALCAAAIGAVSAQAEYVQLDALQSGGEQYVQTDFKLDSRDAVEVKYRTSQMITGNQWMFCNRNAFSDKTFGLFVNSSTGPRWDYGEEKANSQYSNVKNAICTLYVVNVNGNTGKWTVNGVEQTGKSQTPATFTPGGPLVFLAGYSDGTTSPVTAENYARVTFFYAKIWGSDGTLKHYLVPAENTDYADEKERYGLLDIADPDSANWKFYPNKGSAALIVAVTETEDVYGNAISYDGDGSLYWFWRGDKTAEDDSVSKADSTVAYSDGGCNIHGLAIVIR